MATGIVFQNNQYTGALNPEILLATIASSQTLEGKLAVLHPNILGKKVFRKANQEVVLQDGIAAFSPEGVLTVSSTDAILEPKRMSVMYEIDKFDLLSSYEADEISPASLQGFGLPQALKQSLFEDVARKVSLTVEQRAWTGKSFDPTLSLTTQPIDGFIPLLLANAPVARKNAIPTSGRYAATAITSGGVMTMVSTAGLQSGDVITILSVASAVTTEGTSVVRKDFQIVVLNATTIQLTLWNRLTVLDGTAPVVTGAGTLAITFGTLNALSIDQAIRIADRSLPTNVLATNVKGYGEKVIAVSPVHIQALYDFMLGAGLNPQYTTLNPLNVDASDNTMLVYRGMKIIGVAGLQANTVVCYRTNNFHVGFSLANDFSNIQFIDKSQTTGEQKFAFRLDFSLDSMVGYANEVGMVYPV